VRPQARLAIHGTGPSQQPVRKTAARHLTFAALRASAGRLTKEEKPCLLPLTTTAARPASGSRSCQAPLEQRKRIRTPPRPRPASVPPRRPPGEGHPGKPLPRCQRPRPPAPGRTGQATGSRPVRPARVGGTARDHRDADLRAGGMGVVQRHVGGGAEETVAARLPVQVRHGRVPVTVTNRACQPNKGAPDSAVVVPLMTSEVTRRPTEGHYDWEPSCGRARHTRRTRPTVTDSHAGRGYPGRHEPADGS
jgi:hypothetical protein